MPIDFDRRLWMLYINSTFAFGALGFWTAYSCRNQRRSWSVIHKAIDQ
jgi:hypothetical protein